MTGYTPREIEALFDNCLGRMVVEEDRAQLMQEIHALCAYPHEETVSFRVTVKDGRRMRVEERCAPSVRRTAPFGCTAW